MQTEKIEHLKAGYSNCQERIRDLDTKTNVLFGFQIAIVGLLVTAAFSVSEGEVDLGFNDCGSLVDSYVLIIVWAISVFLGMLSLLFLISTLKARGPNGKASYSVLFPFYDDKKASADYEKAVEGFLGFGEDQIVKEYKDQLKQVGSILFKKIKTNQRSEVCLRLQILFILVGTLMFVIV